MRTEGVAPEDVAHVVLRDHGALELGQAVAVCHNCVVEVALGGDVPGEVVHGVLIEAGLLEMGCKILGARDVPDNYI